ncbi:hypothetical protein BDW22DRAFT_1385538 [Trametopsis cervina]|nr:hypothetical protein BDW22DRAFT_1385538 [Trametopsis cervina]
MRHSGIAPPPVLQCILLVVACANLAFANTEIVNIVATDAADVHFPHPPTWAVLSSNASEQLWRAQPAPLHTSLDKVCVSQDGSTCAHERWAVLDFDSPGWSRFSKFTLRISWPAFHPTDFYIQVFSPEELWAIHNATSAPSIPIPSDMTQVAKPRTRRKYARVRLVDTGVRVPAKEVHNAEATPFMIILEPLYWTILPASVFSILLFLAPIVLFAALFVYPRTHDYLSKVAESVKSEREEDRLLKDQ